MLRLITLTTLFLITTTLALPSTLQSRADEDCTPASYTLSSYTLSTSPSLGHVSFIFSSSFSNPSIITDSATDSVKCFADGAVIPNSNECRVGSRKLLFDLRGPQEEANYQITHTWVCDGSTWMSGTPVKIDPLGCMSDGTTRICSSDAQIIVPQNVRKICGTPTC